MSVASDFAATLARTEWATRFVDTCVIQRRDPDNDTFNETTGQTEEAFTQVYSGGCLVRPASASETDFGEDRRQEVDFDLFLPHDAAELEHGDQVTVSSGLDPIIPVLTVLRGFSDSYLTRQRYETKVVLP
jgi:hypothetical protein